MKFYVPAHEKLMRRRASFLLFLLGLGSETKVYFFDCIAFSEFAVFVLAPIMLFFHYRRMRQELIVVALEMWTRATISRSPRLNTIRVNPLIKYEHNN